VQLISGYGEDTLTTLLVTNYDWYILPVVNPDGYEYSNTTVMSYYTVLLVKYIRQVNKNSSNQKCVVI